MKDKTDYVTRDTAMLAKDNGYTELNYTFYNIYDDDDDEVHGGYSNNLLIPIRISAPTQTSLQKWLRDEKNIHLTVIHRNDIITNIGSYDFLLENTDVKYHNFKTWEEALEIGLRFALNLIK